MDRDAPFSAVALDHLRMSEARIRFYGADEPPDRLNARINQRAVAMKSGYTLRQAINVERGIPVNGTDDVAVFVCQKPECQKPE